ncbi:uncharacterized protein SCHCODRAFT_02679974 [Schizophyllum commune H4-8]|uniref:Fungal-type protein kinase domain-containing protein n=1 Tax=Schizophyllum commune (strain H4-8 / FGSC 9210) TaxID=578458 RepID=D8QC16_SCHCM|nr:uncharacterized protein SCHCODRAFT_02679974 [Schizophyllum commune H4-8]KAI5889401.1 hypothetical protein SCHCODRAFT_02679974 [Schizophyllum commune H4-8]
MADKVADARMVSWNNGTATNPPDHAGLEAVTLLSMADRIQYCSLEEFRKCYLEGVGFRTLGRTQLRTIEARLRKQGKLDKHGWTALRTWGTEDASSPRLQWTAMEVVISSIQRAAQWAHPKRFGEKKRNAHFESRYRAKMAPFQEGYMELLKKKAPRGTRLGTAFDVPLISREDATRGLVYGADIGVSVCWDNRDDDDNTAMRSLVNNIGAASFLLYNDRRRAFQFTMTMRGTRVQFWCHSRSHSVGTFQMDVNKCYREFIHFVLFILYANEAQLGFDPTVIRVVDAHGRPQYQFDVVHEGEETPRVYQTLDVLFQCAFTNALHDRAMAVYRVCPATKGDGLSARFDPANHRVLKDFAQLATKPYELAERNRILECLKNAAQTPEERARCDGFFTTVLADFEVFDMADRSPYPDQALNLVPLRRRRTLVKEVCDDLYAIENGVLCFYTLAESSTILLFFMRAGVVHGDISPGNILMPLVRPRCGSENYSAVRIADFEYTKDYSKAVEGLKTGTPEYMAVEVQAGQHLFYAEDAPEALLARHHWSYNFYYDAEPLIWIALDFALSRFRLEAGEEKQPEELCQQQLFRDSIITCSPEGTHARQDLMMGEFFQLGRLKLILERAYGPKSPMLLLVGLVIKMGNAHRAAQGSQLIPEDEEPGDDVFRQLEKENFDEDIYIVMHEAFMMISEALEDVDLIPLRNAGIDQETVASYDAPELMRQLDQSIVDALTPEEKALIGLAPAPMSLDAAKEEMHEHPDEVPSTAHSDGEVSLLGPVSLENTASEETASHSDHVASSTTDEEQLLDDYAPIMEHAEAESEEDHCTTAAALPLAHEVMAPNNRDAREAEEREASELKRNNSGRVTFPWLKLVGESESSPAASHAVKKSRKRQENDENCPTPVVDKSSVAEASRMMLPKFGGTKLGNQLPLQG